jgi:YD repeat-containing protein
MTEHEQGHTVVAEDATRGRRRIHVGAGGTPTWVERADGSRLRIERDDRRRSLRISDDDGQLCALRGTQTGLGAEVTATDRSGATTARRNEHTTRVTRRTGAGDTVLRVDRDGADNLRRVTLPGSDLDLIYRPDGAGRWVVQTSDGRTVMTIVAAGTDRTVSLADGWGWHESVRPGLVEIADPAGTRLVATELDRAGRVVGRIDSDGARHTYERDEQGRLVGWSSPHGTVRWELGEYGIEAVVSGTRRRRWRRDGGSRVVAQAGNGATVRYAYDAGGHRTRRHGPDGETRYCYDALGQLTGVHHADGHRTAIGWDGLGRRVWVEHDGRRLDEHRDLQGRLWAVTDADGRAVHVFVWFEGRVVARLDGPVGSPVAEAYLTDPVGTLLACARPDGDRWMIEDAVGNPYGVVTGAYRPTLFGHVGDAASGLICFGSRHLDPETASFLTPDPWHGGPDDPRVLGGASPSGLALNEEVPRRGIHPYALSQHDPTSRPDLDGHFAWGNAILTLLLAPTWGFPLTSLSLFFFLPVNLYFELVGLIVFIFTDHPWPQHSIVNSIGMSGSSRLGTFGFALNGFLPRVIAGGGVDRDRAVTIGHVIWANRRYFELLDRPRVLTVQDVAGPPDPVSGVPSGGPTAFTRTAKGSIVVVEGTDADRRLWIHGSSWTRGGASHVGVRGGDQTFEDHVAPGTAHSTGSLLLAQPLPEAMTRPMRPDDSGRLEVTEYLAGGTSVGEVVADAWFAVAVAADAGLGVGDAVRVQASDRNVAPAYAGIHQVIQGDRPILVLDHPLPTRFQVGSLKAGLKLAELTPATGADAGASSGWIAPPAGSLALARRTLQVADPGHRVRTGDALRIEPQPTAPAPERPFVYGEVEVVRVTLELTVAPPAGQTGATAVLLAPDGTVGRGRVDDPVDHSEQVTVIGEPVLEVGDAVAVVVTGGGPHHARVSAATAASDSDPASITLDPPIPATVVGTTGTTVNLARLASTDRDRDTGSVDDQTATGVVVSARSNQLFHADAPIQLEQGAATAVRTVGSVSATTVVLRDEMVAAAGPAIGPDFNVVVQAVAASTARGDIAADRFVKHVSGDLPSAYGAWPNEVMGLVPTAYSAAREPTGWRFFVPAPGPADRLHPSYQEKWQPLTLGTDHYWLLTSPLRIVEDDGAFNWEPDPDDTYPRRHRQAIGSPPWQLNLRRFQRGAPPVHRPLTGGDKVLCRRAETQVPDAPRQRWSLADALDEHELGHTLQNTYWGPLLGALPLQGLFRTVADTFAAAGEERPAWMLWNPFDHAGDGFGFDDTNMFELVSMAGLMQLVWTFVILGPSLFQLLGDGDEGEQRFAEKVLGMNWSDWGQVFNPVNQQIINRIPEIDPEADAGERWGLHLAHVVARATDMRAWTPLVGLVPLWLPDGPTNFVEQQASRWSGDLYSTILTIGDRSNRDLRLRFGSARIAEKRDGDRTIPLGRAARIMVYGESPLDRYLLSDQCDAPTQLRYQTQGGAAHQLIRIKVDAIPGGGVGLVPAGHFELVGGTALTSRTIVGPEVTDATGAATRRDFTFGEVSVNDEVRPLPRSLVPAAPAVVRTAGIYFVPAGAGTFTARAHSRHAGSGDEDPHTYHATITVAGEVELGSDTIDWATPLAKGTSHPAATAPAASRFETETAPLTVAGQDTSDWIAEGEAGLSPARAPGGRGWTVTFADPGGGLPARSRIRIWRPVRPDDPDLFDFEHEDEPTRAGIRSYLDDELWLPVRDFPVEILALPALPDASIAAADHHELALVIKLAGPASIVVTPTGGRTLRHERIGDDGPRGERWRLELDGRKAVETDLVFPVQVTFGTGTGSVRRGFELTVTPNFTLDTDPAGGPYTVSAAGGPRTLRIGGGTAPFRVTSALPDGMSAELTGTTITISAEDTARAGEHVLTVTDGDGRLGERRIVIEL